MNPISENKNYTLYRLNYNQNTANKQNDYYVTSCFIGESHDWRQVNQHGVYLEKNVNAIGLNSISKWLLSKTQTTNLSLDNMSAKNIIWQTVTNITRKETMGKVHAHARAHTHTHTQDLDPRPKPQFYTYEGWKCHLTQRTLAINQIIYLCL